MIDQRRTKGALLGLCLAAALTSGCGIGVELTTTTGQVAAGALVPFTVGLTNNTACPVGQPLGILLPFLPAQAFTPTGQSDIDDIFLALINAACGGEAVQFPDGITCSIVDQNLVCEEGDPPLTTGDVPSVDVPVRAGDTLIANCHREGSKLTCKFDSPLANASVGPVDPLLCLPVGGGLIVCAANGLEPGASATASFDLHAPISPGVYRTLLFGVAQDTGVCNGGTEAGNACGQDSDCGGGICSTGICVNGMTQATGDGCTTNTDCGMGETCVTCQPPLGPSFTVPLACAQITVAASAPAQSFWGMAASALALLALGFFGIRRLRRSQG